MKLSLKPVKSVASYVFKGARKHSPEILTAIGIVGMVTTVVMAVNATPKALEKISEDHPDGCTKVEVVKSAWKFYIPTAVTGACSIACIVGATRINLKRNAALATAYTLSEAFAKEYKENVIEAVGEKKAAEINENIAKKRIENVELNKNDISSGDETTWFFDPYSGRPFKSSMNRLAKIQNEINNLILTESYISLNELYYKVGLDTTKSGDQLGWDNGKGLLEFHYTPILSNEIDEAGNRIPVISLDFNVEPISLY